MLSYIGQLMELSELLEARPVVEILSPLFYGLDRACWYTLPALSAVSLQRLIRFKRHIRKNGCQPESGSQFVVDKKIIPSYPSQSGQVADLLVREMPASLLKIFY